MEGLHKSMNFYFFQLILGYSDIMAIELKGKRNSAFDAIAATMGHKNLLSSIQFLMLPILIYLFTSGKKIVKILENLNYNSLLKKTFYDIPNKK